MTQQPRIQIDAIARHDLDETFADSFSSINFDGQVCRIEFCSTRMDEPAGDMMRGKRIPVCRLVLPAKTTFDLADKLNGLLAELEKRGVIKRVQPTQMAPGSSTAN